MTWNLFKIFRLKWHHYRYRFVPWIIFNLKNRKVRTVSKELNSDKIITDEAAIKTMLNVFSEFDTIENSEISSEAYQERLHTMHRVMGFSIHRAPSCLPGCGVGVTVTQGRIPNGTVVSMYPGTIYESYNPVLIQSFGNSYIFRCVDGKLIDGNDRNLSKYIYRSCSERDRHGPYMTCDTSWMTQFPLNPLAIGQYVNNQSKRYPANVAYQEVDVPADFPFHLLKYIPNIHFTPLSDHINPPTARLRRVVVLVSLKDICQGEELFSSYFTVIH